MWPRHETVIMLLRPRVWVIPFLALPLLAMVCGEEQYTHAPIVRNSLNRPLVVSVVYGNGDFSYGMDVAPGAKGYAPAEGIGVDEISVRACGEILFTVKKERLELLRSDFPPGMRLMWEINEDGVTATAAPD